jgi:hypothetical protein
MRKNTKDFSEDMEAQVSGPRFEPRASQIRNRLVKCSVATFGLSDFVKYIHSDNEFLT